jgi:hypothetical protein
MSAREQVYVLLRILAMTARHIQDNPSTLHIHISYNAYSVQLYNQPTMPTAYYYAYIQKVPIIDHRTESN